MTRHTCIGMQKTSWPGAHSMSQLLLPYPLALAVFSTALLACGPLACSYIQEDICILLR